VVTFGACISLQFVCFKYIYIHTHTICYSFIKQVYIKPDTIMSQK
jgi:hypothetical protein